MRNIVLIASLVTLLSAVCIVNADRVKGTGTVKYLDFEGGFYGIIADDGARYDPHDLPVKYRHDGLRIRFEAIVIPDGACYHQWGVTVEIVKIDPL